MIINSNRTKDVQEYYFSKKLKEVSKLINQGEPIINMGIGSPDIFPSVKVIKALKMSLNDPSAHKYQSYYGLSELRSAISNFYKSFFGINLDPSKQVLPLIGSKEGIMHISLAFLNPGDKVLIPNPGYPTYLSVTKLVEAKPLLYELNEQNGWFPNIEDLEKKDLSGVKIMWINYPHMPSGASAKIEQFEKLVSFTRKNNILLVNDNPYSFILNKSLLSLMSVQRSFDNCLELNSLSKSFNLAGWRVGMLIGSENHISSVMKVKSNMDSGMFYGIQKGAIEALSLEISWFESINKIYSKRRKLVWKLARLMKCEFDTDSSGLFVWAKLPKRFKNSKEFVDRILQDKKLFIAPGSIFGSNGEGYVRFSLCVSEKNILNAIKRLKS
ncbi:MAG: aminotransferase [Flavobacteriaceae bacterium]|nr:aminotransferase [Flavobacteriaceae bacterium]|tara:strand:+ start:4897 stop:6048 length:1152 start_codon:yes stop_codon:yes gene_type:complete